MLDRPTETEYPEFYEPYVKLVPEGNLLDILKKDLDTTVSLFEGISETDQLFRYEQGKWSIKEVLCHMTDTERIMSYRLLRVGRGDQTPLAGFDENNFIAGSQASQVPMENLIKEFIAVRSAAIALIENMPDTAWENKGFANNLEITTRAIAYIIAGHALHHKKVIEERYLSKLK